MEKVRVEPFKVIGISVRTSNEEALSKNTIGELWGKFMSEQIMDHIPNKLNSSIYSLYTDYEGDHTQPYTAILGCEVSHLNTIPNGMIGKSFVGGDFLKIVAAGDLTRGLIIKEWSKIWRMNLNRIYMVDFEVYDKRAKNIEKAEVDILVGIK